MQGCLMVLYLVHFLNSYTYLHTDVYEKVATNPQGLTKEEAKVRLERDGKNAIQEKARKGWFLRFLDQFKDMMIIVLIIAALISAVLVFVEEEPEYLELIDSGVILLIVLRKLDLIPV